MIIWCSTLETRLSEYHDRKPNLLFPSQILNNGPQLSSHNHGAFFSYKFPHRSQELLLYLSLIRYAARVLRDVGWAVYDYKFRQKAGHNKYRVCSEIGQQLWLTIFTVKPVLKEEYPSFFKGPQTNSVVFTVISMGLLPLSMLPLGVVFGYSSIGNTLCVFVGMTCFVQVALCPIDALSAILVDCASKIALLPW